MGSRWLTWAQSGLAVHRHVPAVWPAWSCLWAGSARASLAVGRSRMASVCTIWAIFPCFVHLPTSSALAWAHSRDKAKVLGANKPIRTNFFQAPACTTSAHLQWAETSHVAQNGVRWEGATQVRGKKWRIRPLTPSICPFVDVCKDRASLRMSVKPLG